MAAASSTSEVIKGTQIQRESADSLNARYRVLIDTTFDAMMAGLVEAGIPRRQALGLVVAACDAFRNMARLYSEVYRALNDVASTLEAVEKARAAAEAGESPGKFAIN